MQLTNSYLALGGNFYQRIAPEKVEKPELFLWNRELAAQLCLSTEFQQNSRLLADIFSGNDKSVANNAVALAYAGHQFGGFVPQLGDGRAHLLGELHDINGTRLDIQLKGSGPTRFSRNGDGRCGMGPAIREFIMSEAMYALGVPTARSLAVVTTGETVFRDQPQPGAVVTRVAASHLRVGSFEYFAARKDYDSVEKLSDYAIERHYPQIKSRDPARFVSLLEAVIENQIKTIIEWLRVGFIHGVMNTDNTTISGQTIDFGPCAMMGIYDLQTVYSSIDRQGRYAYGNQPSILQWNMARLAETMMPLIDKDQDKALEKINELFDRHFQHFHQPYFSMLGRKIGLADVGSEEHKLIAGLLDILEKNRLDYTISFLQLTQWLNEEIEFDQLDDALKNWAMDWKSRLKQKTADMTEAIFLMQQSNPVVIPRNHHVESVIENCINSGKPEPAETFLKVLRSPYKALDSTFFYQDAPGDGDSGYHTFCGT